MNQSIKWGNVVSLVWSSSPLGIVGHSTSNEMMAHALRPRILFNFF